MIFRTIAILTLGAMMAVVPQTGSGVPTVPGQSREQQITSLAAQLNQQFPPADGQNLGNAFIKYMDAHPQANPIVIFTNVVSELAAIQAGGGLGGLLGGAIGQVVGADGQLTAEAAAGTVKGAESVDKTLSSVTNPLNFLAGISQFFSDLTNPQMWFRLGKIALGAVLLLIGMVQITHLDQKITSVVGAAAKVAV